MPTWKDDSKQCFPFTASYFCLGDLYTTIDGWNPANQLRLVVEIPLIYRVLIHPRVVGLGISEPSTVKNTPTTPVLTLTPPPSTKKAATSQRETRGLQYVSSSMNACACCQVDGALMIQVGEEFVGGRSCRQINKRGTQWPTTCAGLMSQWGAQ